MQMKTLVIILILVFPFIHFDKGMTSVINPQAGTHTIGEHFGGGIIFYIDSTGKHGLIAAPSDLKKTKWYNGNYIATKATGTAVGTGLSNTMAIVEAQGSGNYAASECVNLELSGFSDWFLPSKDELSLLRTKKTVVGGFEGQSYWCSTEYNSQYAWGENFNTGFQNYGNKNSAPSVRAIRAF